MTRFDVETCSVAWPGLELTIHNGTVRDLAFVSRASGTPVLVSGGAGTCHYCYYYLKSAFSQTGTHAEAWSLITKTINHYNCITTLKINQLKWNQDPKLYLWVVKSQCTNLITCSRSRNGRWQQTNWTWKCACDLSLVHTQAHTSSCVLGSRFLPHSFLV